MWNYAVKDNVTGIVYQTAPFHVDLPVGAQVDFALSRGNGGLMPWDDDSEFGKTAGGRWDGEYADGNPPGKSGAVNTQSQTNNMVANMQKARHDAMMATIQNAR